MFSRRNFLKLSVASGLVAVAPGLSVAAAPGDNRFVFIILRGGLDGLAAVQPYGDPALAVLRPELARTPANGLIDLDGFFGLAQEFSGLADLWRQKELVLVHAVSSPYRARSHFEGQDTLENGTDSAGGARDGWLNRFLSLVPASDVDFAADLMPSSSLVLAGSNRVSRWEPTADLKLAGDAEFFLRQLYRDHPDFTEALDRAIISEAGDIDGPERRGETKSGGYAKLAAKMLSARARIAALSISGWDTHQNQAAVLRRPARELTDAVATLKTELGPLWKKTTFVAVSEFGRTVRQNGTRGTDHGTGGVMWVGGGAVNGGRMAGPSWPGLGEGRLYENRDLMPVDDVRRYLAWLLMSLFGTTRDQIATSVFPGVDIGSDPRLL
jgi:uncharacterized protein (DUF1501 family)